jgi:hypothetical protein
MNRILMIALAVCLLLSACAPSQGATPVATPAPYTLNNSEEIKTFLEGWTPVAKGMGYSYEITDVSPEKDANGNIIAWDISAKDPGPTYTEGMCVVPIIGLSMLVKNYKDTGRSGQIQNIAPGSLKLIRVVCVDLHGVEKQKINTRWVDVVRLGQGALDTSHMLMQLTIVP